MRSAFIALILAGTCLTGCTDEVTRENCIDSLRKAYCKGSVGGYDCTEAGKIPEYQQAVAQCMAIGRR